MPSSSKGLHLFTSDQDDDYFYSPPGSDKHMKYHGFKVWKQFIVQVNEDSARKRDADSWWRFASVVDGFNKVYRENITTSIWDILYEAISAFLPRSNATSKLPKISLILRKPEALGSEFKYVACPAVGTVKCLEIQCDAKPMQNAKYSREHGCTSDCSLRLVDASDKPIEHGQKRGMKGNSWFGHTPLANKLGTQGVRAVLQIKTGHAIFPEKFLDEELAEAPGGCWIMMMGKGPRRTNLLAIGYKYNIKWVLKLVATTAAGSTKAWTPYDMRFTDAYSNYSMIRILLISQPCASVRIGT
jgi:hypothetical protein